MITRDQSAEWLDRYIVERDAIDYIGTVTSTQDGMSDERWAEAVDFVWRCMSAGIKPLEYVELLIESQRAMNKREDCGEL